MASTRNRNTAGNYCLEQRQNIRATQWNLYENGAGGNAYNTQFAGTGLNPGRMAADNLSKNATDTETFLWGIGSTNLVKPRDTFEPQITQLSSFNLYKKEKTIMPVPLVVPKNQRPNLC